MSDSAESHASSESSLDLSEPDYSRLNTLTSIAIALQVAHIPDYRIAKLCADNLAREAIRHMDKQAAIRAERAAWRRDHPTRLTRIGRVVWSIIRRLFGCQVERSDSQPSSLADIELVTRDTDDQSKAEGTSGTAAPDVENLPKQSAPSGRPEIV
ncbi:hypothetical protein PENSPDRAFT_737778 [Peniophora sp. CONT]|nr:hypothetical protein PENSPDRAFT_737778 [Peniophora sp. CONT]